MIRTLTIAALLVLFGCADELPDSDCGGLKYQPNVRSPSPADLPLFAPAIQAAPDHITIRVNFNDLNNHGVDPINSGSRSYCYDPGPHFIAKVDDLTAVVATPGGWDCFGGTIGPLCRVPIMTIELPPGYSLAGKQVEITDENYDQTFPIPSP